MKKVHRIILWGTISLTIIIGLIFWLVLLLECHPISFFWTQADGKHTGSCLPVKTLLDVAYVYSAFTIVCDFTLGFLPIFLVWELQMNRRTKTAVGGILSLGAMYVLWANRILNGNEQANKHQCECSRHHSTTIPSSLCRH